MLPSSFIRKHTCTVVLGISSTPFQDLLRIYQSTGTPPLVVAPDFPVSLLLCPFIKRQKSADSRFGELLLIELSDLAMRLPDKQITLIPASAPARRFVKENRTRLEADFIISQAQQ